MDERSLRVARRFETPVLVAALLVIPVIAIEESTLGDPWRAAAAITNWCIWLVFAAELVTMLWVVPERGQWLFKHPLEVAIVVLTPPFAPALLQTLRGARALRLLRLLRLLPVLRSAALARRVFSVEGLRYAALVAGLALLAGGAAFAAVEDGHHSEKVTAWDGLWWAITTTTTVGYGDLYPVTNGGRVIAVGLMAVGIAFVGFLTAAIAQRFILPTVEKDIERATSQQFAEDAHLLGQLESLRREIEKIEDALRARAAPVVGHDAEDAC